MRTLSLIALALLAACTTGRHHPHDSAFSAASGISRASEATADSFQLSPLRPMTGDVEILRGDPEKPGEPFVMRIRELPGTIIPLHTHPVDEYITIVQGTWYFAVGDKWDKAALRELRTGDFAFVPKGRAMYGYCPDGAIVQVHGTGPFVIRWQHGSKSLDDPDAASTFQFRRGDRVKTPRGDGVIKEGYASGEIIQYVVETATGDLFMANQSDTQRP